MFAMDSINVLEQHHGLDKTFNGINITDGSRKNEAILLHKFVPRSVEKVLEHERPLLTEVTRNYLNETEYKCILCIN